MPTPLSGLLLAPTEPTSPLFLDLTCDITGHTHERYLLETNSNSFISQCGSMGEFLTALNIGIDDQRKLHIVKNVKYGRLTEIESPQCVRINSDVGMDAVFDQRITGWIAEINEIFEMEYSSIVFKGT